MELSAKAEYACLAMCELAKRHERGMPTSLKELAEQLGISHAFLMQIFMALKSARLVKGLRGPGGGFKLGRSPESLSLLNIVEAIDGLDNGTSALNALPNTPMIRSLQQLEKKAEQAARQVLGAMTLGDLARQSPESGTLEYQI
ncbi:MAG TPA: Rrf2 family transcriptional regulator [Gemmataceae bacterium]|nr:Rrf2 family transcriptional regulator [Gemmataceae bacterium]